MNVKRLALCFVLVGCGGDDSGGGGNGTVDLDTFGFELAEVSCAQQFDCCTDAEIMAAYMGLTIEGEPITTEEQCVQVANGFITGFGVPQWKESIAAGRLDYDGEAAADCVAALKSLTCDQYNVALSVVIAAGCRAFLLAKVEVGGACLHDDECTTGNCAGEKNSTTEPDVDGACQPMPTQGEPCDDNCAEGLYCTFNTSTGNKFCQPLKAEGAACTYDHDCVSDYCDEATDICATEAVTCDGR